MIFRLDLLVELDFEIERRTDENRRAIKRIDRRRLGGAREDGGGRKGGEKRTHGKPPFSLQTIVNRAGIPAGDDNGMTKGRRVAAARAGLRRGAQKP